MPYDLSEPLVIGISSRALFNLEQENKIFEEQGLTAYEEYQVKHENDILQKGSAFQLVNAFLNLNKLQDRRLVEVIVMSRNSPNTSLRIFNSIKDYELDITSVCFSDSMEHILSPGIFGWLKRKIRKPVMAISECLAIATDGRKAQHK